MFDTALGVAIGLVLVFLVFSMVVSGIYEGIARFLAWRAKDLWASVRLLLVPEDAPTSAAAGEARLGVPLRPGGSRDHRPTGAAAAAADPAVPDVDLVAAFYAHPLIGGLEPLANDQRTKVASIAPDSFARALIDVLVPEGDGETSVSTLRTAIRRSDLPMKQPLLQVVSEVGESLDAFRQQVGAMFDQQMTHLSTLYRRRAKAIMFGIGLFVAVVANVDALHVAGALYGDDALRSATTVAAKELVESCEGKTGDDLSACLAEAKVSLDDQVTMPVGWGTAVDGRSFCGWEAVGWMLGWLLTAVALMQGGPFWFDVLKRATSRAPGAGAGAGAAGTSSRS